MVNSELSARKAFIAKATPYSWLIKHDDGLKSDPNLKDRKLKSIPLVRKLLGDEAYFSIGIRSDADAALIDEAILLFPESMIGRVLSNGSFYQVLPNRH